MSASKNSFRKAERWQSAARDRRTIHPTRFYRESAALRGSIYRPRKGLGCEPQLCQNGTFGGG